jgi:hypothetical protein
MSYLPSDLLTTDENGVQVNGERRLKTDMTPTLGSDFSNSFETSDDGTTALGVFVQDQTSNLLSVPFLIERSSSSLAVDAIADGVNRTVTLQPGHGAIVGDILEVADTLSSSLFMQAEIVSISGDNITVDQPINYPYAVATTVVVVSSDEMNVDGSVTPQVFSVLPLPSQSGDMVRVIFEMRDNSDMDFTTFGGIAALTNGCVLRINNGDGTYKNLFNFKDNGDIIEQCFDHTFLDATGNSARGFTARLTWGGQSKHGVVIRIRGSLGKALELVVQDNLTGLTRFHLTAQGHEIQG